MPRLPTWLRLGVRESLWRAWQAHACSRQVWLHQAALLAWPGHRALKHTSAGGLGMWCWFPTAALSRCTCLTVEVSTAPFAPSMETLLSIFMVSCILQLLSGCKLGSSAVRSLLHQSRV